MEPSPDRLRDAYRTMRTIRVFEQTLNELSQAGKVPGFLHLYAGEEAIAGGVCAHLGEHDWVASTHRGHGHSIAKGVDLNAMMAEIFGRRTGGVAVSFFGDGATNEGAFHESCNLAAIYKLPCLFVIENNGYGEATPAEYAAVIPDLAARAAAYGIPGVVADGMDFFDVFGKAGEALARARRGEGPSLLECKSYRYYGHYVGDPLTYRTKEEGERVRATRDPLETFAARVTRAGTVAAGDLERIDDEVMAAVAAAVKFAEASPLPDAADLTTDVYVRYGAGEEA